MDESDGTVSLFKTYVIIEFEDTCRDDVKSWFESKLSATKANHGSEFLTRFSKNFENKVFD